MGSTKQLYDIAVGNIAGGNITSTGNITDIIKKDKSLINGYKEVKKLSNDELEQKIYELEKKLEEKDKLISALEEDTKPTKNKKDIDIYNILNLFKFFKTEDGKLYNPDPTKRTKDEDGNYLIATELYKYDPFESAFDKNQRTGLVKFRDYQKEIIQAFSVSAQELVILNYSVGSGKTLIAINCAEQFVEINKNSYVYFVLPASLVLGTILEMYSKGIDASRKYPDGSYIYNFISYQQLLRSSFNFNENSLLILDEAHNCRNLHSKEISNKISARKWEKSGNYSLIGNKLAELLLQNSNTIIKKLFITGTLFVNSSKDIEALIAIGYNKRPMFDIDEKQYQLMIRDDNEFKNYYQGLISYYKISGESKKLMPTVKYEFLQIKANPLKLVYDRKNDPYYVNTRNNDNDLKIDYIFKFLKANPNDKTLIYSQFLDASISKLIDILTKNKLKFGFISGALSQVEKLNVVRMYNTGEINILIFTLSIKEGISFKLTNNIFIIEPYWNMAILEQVIARGVRLNSHPLGYKSTVNVILPVVCPDNSETTKWLKNANECMNKDIHTLEYERNKEGIILSTPFKNDCQSRDIYIYNKMFNKQEEINVFEKKLLALPSFEKVNNVENNEFIKIYNKALLDYENANGKLPTNIQMISLKKQLYGEFYKSNIDETNKRIQRFNKDVNYLSSRNPDLEEKADLTKYPDIEDRLRVLISKNTSLEDLFKEFKIDKQTITSFQANFTPTPQIKELLRISGIANDKNKIIKVLEPTCGIGGVIGELIQNTNANNYLIDGNEFFGVFYQIGKIMYEDIDNVKFSNLDFLNYQSKYSYDYILGNPPFNLRTKLKSISKSKDNVISVVYKDATVYDIDFVAKSYNLLSNNGILTFIISNRFQRDDSERFKSFNNYLDLLKKMDKDAVFIEPVEEAFKADNKITKSQETSYGMVYIKLKKLNNININLKKTPPNISEINDNKDIKEEPIKKKVAKKRVSKKKVKEVIKEEPAPEPIPEPVEEPVIKPRRRR